MDAVITSREGSASGTAVVNAVLEIPPDIPDLMPGTINAQWPGSSAEEQALLIPVIRRIFDVLTELAGEVGAIDTISVTNPRPQMLEIDVTLADFSFYLTPQPEVWMERVLTVVFREQIVLVETLGDPQETED